MFTREVLASCVTSLPLTLGYLYILKIKKKKKKERKKERKKRLVLNVGIFIYFENFKKPTLILGILVYFLKLKKEKDDK